MSLMIPIQLKGKLCKIRDSVQPNTEHLFCFSSYPTPLTGQFVNLKIKECSPYLSRGNVSMRLKDFCDYSIKFTPTGDYHRVILVYCSCHLNCFTIFTQADMHKAVLYHYTLFIHVFLWNLLIRPDEKISLSVLVMKFNNIG